jgi:two-component system, OmpR family, response regulator BaeR
MTLNPVLIVEDEPKLAALLGDYLTAAGLPHVHVDDGLAVEPAVRRHDPSVVLLDLMLPGLDGMAVCQALRGFTQVPIIMMTARVEEVDRLLGLEMGADDYICKPYSPREVVARVKAQLRRSGWGSAASSPPTGGLQIDDTSLRASVGGQLLDLTPAEFRLLSALASHAGRVFSRDQLLDQLHDDGRAITDRAVDSHIRNLRRKLEAAPGGVDPIRSVYGVGYAWEWPQP